ncbi:hypothetical protein LJR175_008244 [Variovorax sp. LjRoot175]|uniref:hypothetical protein n=1 Tax=Variovorax sp. LjRoot175 TaxID=3342276 RepID=UPI003ECFE657
MASLKTQALLRRVASNSAPEQAFWKAVVLHAHEARPNWGLDLNAGRAPLAVDSFVYLIDTSNFWIAAAAIPPEQLVSMRNEEGETGAAECRAAAADAMKRASSKARTDERAMSSPEALHALAAGIRAIASSPAFGAAADQSPVLDNSHWILLLYHLADGELIAGLGYVNDLYPGMLDRASLRGFIESMVEMDLASEASIVSAAVRAHGGVMLAPELSDAGSS